ncbi:MAG: LacI family DNA-binding transcriptional regulator [Hespellia sp.]|nr:LacI family DNA-binding transcriptional regulator [Hespellia sp.]
MATTIKDVAHECGLSITTVSLVLNNKPNRISEKNKQKIFEAAQKLNYIPSQTAVSMKTKKTNTIGLILPDINNNYFSELAKSMEEECSLHGYTVIYGNTSDNPKKDLTYTTTFLSKGVDVLVVIHSNISSLKEQKKILELAQSTNTPLLSIDREFEKIDVSSISVDRFSGSYQAVKHLTDLGHTRIGCITGTNHSKRSSQRLQGYKQALSDAGLPFEDELVYSGDFHVESGSDAFFYLWNQGVTAIFACNDVMAMGVYLEARRANIDIPRDLSVVGFDDIFFAKYIYPPLTTVAQPITEIGYEAAQQALSMASSTHASTKSTILKTSFVLRESTAPPNIRK